MKVPINFTPDNDIAFGPDPLSKLFEPKEFQIDVEGIIMLVRYANAPRWKDDGAVDVDLEILDVISPPDVRAQWLAATEKRKNESGIV